MTRAQTLHASRSLTVHLHLHLPAEPGVAQLPSLIFAGGGGEGSGEEPHSEAEKGEGALKRTSVKLVNRLASFSRRKTVPHGQMGNCRCSWLGLFRVFLMRRIRWSICNGSEHTAFPEIGIRNALAAHPALGLARSRSAHGRMHGEISWGDTAASGPGRASVNPVHLDCEIASRPIDGRAR